MPFSGESKFSSPFENSAQYKKDITIQYNTVTETCGTVLIHSILKGDIFAWSKHDCAAFTCLGHLWRHDINRNDPNS